MDTFNCGGHRNQQETEGAQRNEVGREPAQTRLFINIVALRVLTLRDLTTGTACGMDGGESGGINTCAADEVWR